MAHKEACPEAWHIKIVLKKKKAQLALGTMKRDAKLKFFKEPYHGVQETSLFRETSAFRALPGSGNKTKAYVSKTKATCTSQGGFLQNLVLFTPSKLLAQYHQGKPLKADVKNVLICFKSFNGSNLYLVGTWESVFFFSFKCVTLALPCVPKPFSMQKVTFEFDLLFRFLLFSDF